MTAASSPVIITYHSISTGDSPLRISPSLFTTQMEWLKTHASVLPLAALLQALVTGAPFPERVVALTFDDGFRDFAESAAPVLRRLALPATVFLPTAYCGRANDWPGQPAWVKPQPLMSWSEIRELAAQGISFGAHSRTHRALTELTPAEAREEIDSSRWEIEQQLNAPVAHFCYPYGLWNPAVRQIVARQYQSACSTAAGVVEPASDPYALPRVDAHYLRLPSVFQSMFTRRFSAYIAGRRWIRRVRGQPEGNYPRLPKKVPQGEI
jgi:peptidoglycan/xylan/chitin deacetylase (PgdA/CDA1 family)